MINVAEHLEVALGPISDGWCDPNGKCQIQVVSFENSPGSGLTTLSTLGLSNYVLKQHGGTSIRQELLTSFESKASLNLVAKVLFAISEHTVETGTSLARGQLITPRYEVDGTPLLTTFYCGNPSPLEPRINLIEQAEPPLIFVYLVALLDSEVQLVRKHGWRWFEEQLDAQDPNVWDLARSVGLQET
jgi:hypothetical protein